MRASLYLRVSTEEQLEGFSIAAQRRACHDHAAAHGWQITAEYCDEGASARKADLRKRPQFRQLMQDAEAHRFDLVLVHKLDRFSRNLRVLLECLEQLGKAGIAFVSISEQMDYSSPWGRFALVMLGGLAQLYSDSLSLETRKGKAERRAQGKHAGLLPFGVILDSNGTPAPDTQSQPNGNTNHAGLIAAFEQSGAGASDGTITAWLNAQGYRTSGNRGANLWRRDAVRRLLVNRFYIGELPIERGHAGWLPGVHKALVPPDLFQRAQSARQQGHHPHVRKDANVYSPSGLLKCAYCLESGDPKRGAIRIHRHSRHTGQWHLFASCLARNAGLICPQRSVPLAVYEEQVAHWLASLRVDEDTLARMQARLEQAKKPPAEGDRERRELGARLKRIKELYEWGDKPKPEYLAQRREIGAQLQALESASPSPVSLALAADLLGSAYAQWLAASDGERNALLGRLVTAIVVRDSKLERIVLRPEFRGFL